MKIIVVIPFYGNWPRDYFPIFAEGLKRNPILHYLFITDNDLPECANEQFIKKHMSFPELRVFIESKLGHSVNLQNSRKLCDLKPSYGHVFQECIKDYDYWAFGDLDILYGNVENVLSGLLEKFDILTFHETWVSGAFTIFRNQSNVNTLFMKSRDFYSVLQNTSCMRFDECGDKYDYLINGNNILNYKTHDSLKNDIECFTYILHKEEKEGNIKIFQKQLIKESVLYKDVIFYDNGELLFNGNKLLHYHFITEKQYRRFHFPRWKSLPNRFTINHTGMYASDSSLLKLWILFRFRVFYNEVYRLIARLYLSINYRLLKRSPQLKYRIDIFR